MLCNFNITKNLFPVLIPINFVTNGVKRTPKPSNYWKDQQNVIQFLNELKTSLQLNSKEDWNSITTKQIQNHGGRSLLRQYSMYEIKCIGYPEGKLFFDKPIQSKGYWDDKTNVKEFLNKLKKKLNIQNIDDWNEITTKQIQDFGGSRLLNKYSLYELKYLACPEGKLIFDKPKQNKPSGYWNNHDNIINFLNELKKNLNIQNIDDWNSITIKQIRYYGGSRLLNKYSLYELKCLACPEGKSIFDKPNQFKPSGYWKNKENVLQFLNELKIKLNLKSKEDWNSITQKQIENHGGRSLLHNYSMYKLKCLGFPDGKLFFTKPLQSKGYWDDQNNISQFFDNLKQKYNLNTPEDWNLNLTKKIIQVNGASSLLRKYSLYELKCLAWPNDDFIFDKPALRNNQKPLSYWQNEENRNVFIQNLKMKYNLNSPNDWKRLSTKQIKLEGGFWLFYNNMEFLHKTIIHFDLSYDENNNSMKQTSFSLKELLESKNLFNKRSAQKWLFLQVQNLFPHDEIVEDYFHPEISRESGFSVQFDIFLIQRNIAIEYHGQQHYEDIPSGFAPLEMHKNRDEEKRNLCLKHGIQLIVIPYWWDNKIDSLRETLNCSIKYQHKLLENDVKI